MCGATTAQTNLQQQQAAYYQQATQEQSQVYGEDQEILNAMKAEYEPILAKGPNQEGFSDSELQDLNATAVEGTATNYAAAKQALGEEQDAAGGGDTVMPSGGAEQEDAQLASSAANQESGEESQIKQADYAQGYNEWQQAGQELGETSAQLNPVGYSGAATSAGSAEGTTADQIASENDSWYNALLGSVGGIVGGAASIYKTAQG